MESGIKKILLRGLDENLPAKLAFRNQSPPQKGWLRAVREALGLSQKEVAARMGIRQQPFAAMEKRESEDAITLSNFRRAADALGCEAVCFLVPKSSAANSFAELADRENPALRHLYSTEHSMALEGQAVGDLPLNLNS